MSQSAVMGDSRSWSFTLGKKTVCQDRFVFNFIFY